MKKTLSIITIASLILSGCAATGEQYQANVYKAGQTNQAQNAVAIKILSVLPAKIEVSNESNRKAAEVSGAVIGGLLGAVVGNKVGKRTDDRGSATLIGGGAGAAAGGAAGSLVSSTSLVDGVNITYNLKGKLLNSAQVGRMCEFTKGDALLVNTQYNETRIQPNAECPVK